ncbi:hypothetical protein BV22DRAFT_1135438 [Leucogyrophana mollusca]|uniref:Uncharacterized protein n=1 Tax=Leucogyrophana mollusca TaxID=85980 RepID=A0ACB8AYA3_9AGAM|nr:hypothetical protein BV22DRAFT_1135438 [Leucogyrophana mollusca]
MTFDDSASDSLLATHDFLRSRSQSSDIHPDEGFTLDTIVSLETNTDGTEIYDRSQGARTLALIGLGVSVIFGGFCVVAGIIIAVTHHSITGIFVISIDNSRAAGMKLALNLAVTLCTESIGFVHSVALRSALAFESRLLFNTNIRLLTAARSRPWSNPNGTLMNAVMAILLVLSYNACLLSTQPVWGDLVYPAFTNVGITSVIFIILGTTILLQCFIAFKSIRSTQCLTWSSSPFDVTAALVHHAHIVPSGKGCMRGVHAADSFGGPSFPLARQPSAWKSHSSVWKIVVVMWSVVVLYVAWGAGLAVMAGEGIQATWSSGNMRFGYQIPLGPTISTIPFWLLFFCNIALTQGSLTLVLHCSEVIANVARDESTWRAATSKRGVPMTSNFLTSALGSWLNIVLLLAKPALHWMFGLCLVVEGYTFSQGSPGGGEPMLLQKVEITMNMVQIMYLSLAMLILAIVFTIVATRQPRGPQPAAYGHIQTLANLIDEWSPVMWWGHKEDGIPYCHAGTSNHPLPDVKMDRVYAGSVSA